MRGQVSRNETVGRRAGSGFTLIELLICVAVMGVLAGLLLPALAQAKKAALRSVCLSQLRQQGLAWSVYLDDHSDRFPDRRDLKISLPGGYKPWADWPKSDPRAGWAAQVLGPAGGMAGIWRCPSAERSGLSRIAQVFQQTGSSTNAPGANYWMWRFDRPDDPVPTDNFWGRTPGEATDSLRDSGNSTVGIISGAADVELAVDAYFPNTVPSVAEPLRGRSAHRGGRNRLLLDGHAYFLRDARTPRD